MVHQMGLSLGRFWAVVIISLWAGVALAAPTAEEIAQRLQARYEDTTSLEARFIQEAFWKSTQRVKVSRGVVFFEKPGKMRWEYKIPEKVLIVADGGNVYVFRPASRQVMVFPSGKALASDITLGFISGRGNILRDFRLRLEGLGPETATLELVPRKPHPQVERLRVLVDLKTYLIRELWYWDYFGNYTRLIFDDIRLNPRLSEELFTFKPPQGVEIIKER